MALIAKIVTITDAQASAAGVIGTCRKIRAFLSETGDDVMRVDLTNSNYRTFRANKQIYYVNNASMSFPVNSCTFWAIGVDSATTVYWGRNAAPADVLYSSLLTVSGLDYKYRQILSGDVAITNIDYSIMDGGTISDVSDLMKIMQYGNIQDEETDPYIDLGENPLPGGGVVGIPGFPGLTATSAGVIGLFAPTAAQMQQLSDFMWTDFGGTATDVFEVLQEILEALKRTISNPLDYIVGLNIIPSQGLSIGGAKSVRFGFVDSGVTMPLLANQYFTVDCGSIAFDTVCGDTFLDYAPYAKFSIYLPYIGFKDVDPNDFVGHSIGVVYHGDCVTGGITAYITKDGSVMYQYSGCCALNVPLSADSWGETISGAISVATGIVAAAATGGAAGVGLAAAKGAASVAANPSLLSPQVNHSGAVSGGAGCMGVQYPFVIREAVNFHSTAGFNKESGYPAYYYKALSEVTGFTTVLDPHINNIPQATQSEMAEIISLLESGVIL